MIFLDVGTPAGVVADNIQKNAGTLEVGCISEFTELVHAGRALVKDHQRRVNRGQIETGVRTAETAITRHRRGRGIDGQQMKYSAAECVNDVRKLCDQIAEFS